MHPSPGHFNAYLLSTFFFFFLMELEFELRALHLQSRCSVTWATLPAQLSTFYEPICVLRHSSCQRDRDTPTGKSTGIPSPFKCHLFGEVLFNGPCYLKWLSTFIHSPLILLFLYISLCEIPLFTYRSPEDRDFFLCPSVEWALHEHFQLLSCLNAGAQAHKGCLESCGEQGPRGCFQKKEKGVQKSHLAWFGKGRQVNFFGMETHKTL
jgi:hypothetical protein